MGKTTSPPTWRDHLQVHPAADLFPRMSPEERIEFDKDIQARGIQTPVTLMQPKDGGDPVLLDGRNRLDATEATGIPVIGAHGKLLVPHEILQEADGFDPVAFVVSKNLHRRHLTTDQRRQIAETLLKQDPEQSDRAIGRLAKLDNKTVEAIRADLELREEIPHVETRTDTRGRRQPVLRRAKETRKAAVDRKPGRSPTQMRDSAISTFGHLLHRDAASTLDDLSRLLRGERGRIAAIPLQKRVALARCYLEALGLSRDDLATEDLPGRVRG